MVTMNSMEQMGNQMDIEGEIAAARARVNEQVAQAAARREQLREASDTLRSLTASARSPRGDVIVVAGADGRIVDVTLSRDAEINPSLGRVITATIAAAQSNARAAAADFAANKFGEDSPLASELRRDPQGA